MTGYYYNPSLPCEDPGEVDALKATTRRTHSGDDDDVSMTRKAEKASTSTKSIWTTSSWFQQQAGPPREEDSSLSKSFSKNERGIGFNDQPVLANCMRPENASNVGGLVHNRFTEKRSQRNPLHPVEAKSVNLFEHNQMSSGMRSIYSKGDGRNSANVNATTSMSPFNSNTAVGKKCLDAFEFAKREHAEKRREHIRAKFTFDFERNKWTLNERALESEDVDRGADEKDAITVAADAADAAANANEENTNNINKNMTIHVEEEMNAAQMLHIQTTRELRLKKHLPRHESALLSAAKKASSSPSSPSSVVATASEDLESAKKKKKIISREEKKVVEEEEEEEREDMLQTDWSRYVLSSGQVVWVDTTDANILEDYAAAKTWMGAQEEEEEERESKSIRVCFFSATKERKGFIDRDAPGPAVDHETFLVFKGDLKSSMEQHERQEQDSTAATTDAMDVDGQQQHGMIADKLKDAAKSTQPKTKEEEILREKLKDAIKIKYAQADEIRALRERVQELENKLLS
ncbi:unnamed protein product [Bathycoccus prasinos]|jgi:hypothetical protein